MSRARLGLVLKRCLQVPLGYMQGGRHAWDVMLSDSACAVVCDPVLGRWLGLTPEQPALHSAWGAPQSGPGQSRVGLVTLPGWVGVGEPRGRLGGLYAKNVTICPT